MFITLVGCAGTAPLSSDGGAKGDSGEEGDGASGDASRSPDGSAKGAASVDSAAVDPDAVVNLTFSGCSPSLSDLRVTTNIVSFDSIAVANATAPTFGSVQVALKNPAPRSVTLSSTQRSTSQNDVVINVMAGGTTYTNFCFTGTAGCTYDSTTKTWKNDPISGTFVVQAYDPKNGKLEVIFQNVVVQDVSSKALCTVNGTLVTKRLSK